MLGDLIKSVKDVKTAITLLHNVISMCAKWWFPVDKICKQSN